MTLEILPTINYPRKKQNYKFSKLSRTNFWNNLDLLYEHFNEHLITSCNHYFDGIIQPVPFLDFPLLLSISQSNLSKPFGNVAIIAFIFSTNKINTGLSLVVPTKVKARKSFLCTEGSLKVENKEHVFISCTYLYNWQGLYHHFMEKSWFPPSPNLDRITVSFD